MTANGLGMTREWYACPTIRLSARPPLRLAFLTRAPHIKVRPYPAIP
jgi:hypothetical protein